MDAEGKKAHWSVWGKRAALQTLAVKMWTGKDCKVPYETFNAARLSLSEGPGVNVAGRIGKTPRNAFGGGVLD